jgi:hypothetical protein
MSNSFSQLKKSSKSNLESLTSELNKLSEKQSGGSNGPDERFWKLTVDKVQNGHAIIRFLPAPSGESLPWVRIFSHAFQGPGGWYIEKSLTTLNRKDPVSEYNTELWNSGVDANKDIARKQKRKLQYVSNILVVSDPANPDNEGKVFLYQYGKKIFDKIQDVMHPEFEDEQAVNPFDFWAGANFRLRARKVEGYRNYDKSDFDSVSVLAEAGPGNPSDADDAELERVWNSQHSLEGLVAPDQFKSYDDLKARFQRVVGVSASSSSVDFDEEPARATQTEDVPASNWEPKSDEDDDESLSYFKKLAEEV